MLPNFNGVAVSHHVALRIDKMLLYRIFVDTSAVIGFGQHGVLDKLPQNTSTSEATAAICLMTSRGRRGRDRSNPGDLVVHTPEHILLCLRLLLVFYSTCIIKQSDYFMIHMIEPQRQDMPFGKNRGAEQ